MQGIRASSARRRMASSQDIFAAGARQSRRSNAGQEGEEPDSTRRDRLEGPEHGVRRRVDANLMELAELTDGNEFVQPGGRPRRLGLRSQVSGLGSKVS